MPKFGEIARSLHKASETSTKFEWTPAAQDAFESLKLKLTSTPILAFSLPQRTVYPLHWRESICHGCRTCKSARWQRASYLLCFQITLKITNKVFRSTPRVASPCIFYTSFSPLAAGSKVHKSNWSKRTSVVTQFQGFRRNNRKMVRKTCTFWLWSASSTRQIHRSCRWVVRIPPSLINAVEIDLPPTSPQSEILKLVTAINNNQELIGNFFDSKDSIAHCVSADFKMSAGIARHSKRKFPTKYPSDLGHSYTLIWPQWLPEERRYLYHLVTKQIP